MHVKGKLTMRGEKPMLVQTARFTGRVFIYHASPMLSEEIEELTARFKRKNLIPHFRRVMSSITPEPHYRTPFFAGL
jgi:hypothetical protein